jgi:hypothetical protein
VHKDCWPDLGACTKMITVWHPHLKLLSRKQAPLERRHQRRVQLDDGFWSGCLKRRSADVAQASKIFLMVFIPVREPAVCKIFMFFIFIRAAVCKGLMLLVLALATICKDLHVPMFILAAIC